MIKCTHVIIQPTHNDDTERTIDSYDNLNLIDGYFHSTELSRVVDSAMPSLCCVCECVVLLHI